MEQSQYEEVRELQRKLWTYIVRGFRMLVELYGIESLAVPQYLSSRAICCYLIGRRYESYLVRFDSLFFSKMKN